MFNHTWPVLWTWIDVISSRSTRFTSPTVSSCQVSLPAVSRPLQYLRLENGNDWTGIITHQAVQVHTLNKKGTRNNVLGPAHEFSKSVSRGKRTTKGALKGNLSRTSSVLCTSRTSGRDRSRMLVAMATSALETDESRQENASVGNSAVPVSRDLGLCSWERSWNVRPRPSLPNPSAIPKGRLSPATA